MESFGQDLELVVVLERSRFFIAYLEEKNSVMKKRNIIAFFALLIVGICHAQIDSSFQKQQQRIETLEKENRELKSNVQRMNRQLNGLQTQINNLSADVGRKIESQQSAINSISDEVNANTENLAVVMKIPVSDVYAQPSVGFTSGGTEAVVLYPDGHADVGRLYQELQTLVEKARRYTVSGPKPDHWGRSRLSCTRSPLPLFHR